MSVGFFLWKYCVLHRMQLQVLILQNLLHLYWSNIMVQTQLEIVVLNLNIYKIQNVKPKT